MKKQIVILVFILLPFAITAQSISVKPQVDERTELMSVIFRLAGANEYVTNDLPDYVARIDTFFMPYKNHAVIKQVQQLREIAGVGYDAVMSMAVHLNIENEHITLKNPLKENSLEKRWDRDSIPSFLSLLNQFYKESNFHQFFEQQKDIREIAERNFAKIVENIDFKWFENFYGERPNGDFHLIISLANGPNNYGASIHYDNGEEEIYAVIGSWTTDSVGNPVYSPNILSTVIHEFNHSFCNPLINSYAVELLPQAENFFKLEDTKLHQMAYGNATTIYLDFKTK
jgi:hypothetical protein